MNEYEILASITVPTNRYQYRLKKDGTRDIDTHFPVHEDLEFRFTADAFAQIVFRDGPDKLGIDDKIMYFNTKDGKLSSICLEDKDHIWIVESVSAFMEACKENYIRMSYGMMVLGDIVRVPDSGASASVSIASDDYFDNNMISDEIMDEFDFAGL